MSGGRKRAFTHHKRTSDSAAAASQAETGASKGDIDDMFGWNQAERAKDMQLHYAGRLERSKKARITMMI